MSDPHNDQPIYTEEFFLNCLLRGGWNTLSLENNFYLITYQGKRGEFPIYGKFIPDNYLVSFLAVYPYTIPQEKIAVVLEYINYTNYGMPFGNLEFKESTNEICFRTSLLFFKIELTGQLINNLISDCVQGMDRYIQGIILLVEKEISVQEAYEAMLSQSE